METGYEDETDSGNAFNVYGSHHIIFAQGWSRSQPFVGFAAYLTARTAYTSVRVLQQVVFAHDSGSPLFLPYTDVDSAFAQGIAPTCLVVDREQSFLQALISYPFVVSSGL